jgi:hypothetical protein
MASRFTFLPDAMPALSVAAGDPPAGSTRRRTVVDVAVTANGSVASSAVPLAAELLDAGDVIDVDRRMIARVDPREAAVSFEPNYMPLVEFVDADFPWRYSLDTSVAERRKPWLVLIALKSSEFANTDPGAGPLPRIRVADASKSLPDLTQSWAFAHVHVSLDGSATPLPDFMRDHPERHFARLICPRRLAPNTAYSLFLVPVFEAGRLRGLGDGSAPPQWNALAWSTVASPVDLPVYFRSRFVTNALEDFELQVRRLKPYHITPDDPVAKPAVAFAGVPGYYADYHNATATFEIQDALVKPGASVQGYNTDPQLAQQLVPTLKAMIAGESVIAATDGPDKDDPLVAMPAYGWRFRQEIAPDAAKAQAGEWFDRISLDLKFRQAAGLGAEAVRRNQELFSAICWQQFAQIADANHHLSRLKTAAVLASSLSTRHFERLPPDVALGLAESLQAFAPAPGGRSVAAVLRDAGLPASMNSRSLRITAAKRARTVTATAIARARPVPMPVAGAAPVIAAAPGPVGAPAPSGPAADLTGPAVSSGPSAPPATPPVRTMPIRFRNAVGALFDMAGMEAPKPEAPLAVGVHAVDRGALASAIAGFLKNLPAKKTMVAIAGLSAAEASAMAPVLRSPKVQIPLVDRLVEFAANSMLRNNDALPPNSLAVVEENPAFVEAFLVGANHEMNNELRWREFPTDMRSTIFARFWNRRRPPDDPSGDDIPPIRNWSKKLGENRLPRGDGGTNFVVLLRCDFIRKLGAVEVVLTRLKDGRTAWSPQDVDSFPASFTGAIASDTAYYGFDIAREIVLASPGRFFFAIYEPAGALRFGLDIATAAVRRARFSYATAALPFLLKAVGRTPGRDAMPAHLRSGQPATGGATGWDDLSWADMTLTGADYIDVVNTQPTVGEPPPLWSAARTSASIARSFLQRPIAAVISATQVLE